MLEWTGERFVPWVDDPALAYEHLHRYAFAARFAPGKRVLDLGSGEGYGTALLARSAASVAGIDIDPEAVRHAREKYGGDNVDFVCASVTSVPFTVPFDVIVCFETLEHIDAQSALVAEARRLLAPEGVFLVSTPDKRAYSEVPHHDNPFHIRELYLEEFRELLDGAFPEVQMFAQRVFAGSRIWRIGSTADPAESDSGQVVVRASENGLEPVSPDDGDPLYFLAVAGTGRLPQAKPGFLADASNALLESHERTRERLTDEVERTRQDKAEAIAWMESRIATLSEALEWRESQVHDFEKARADAAEYVGKLESEIGQKNAHITMLEGMLRRETFRADLAERPIWKKSLDWLRGKNRRAELQDQEGKKN